MKIRKEFLNHDCYLKAKTYFAEPLKQDVFGSSNNAIKIFFKAY